VVRTAPGALAGLSAKTGRAANARPSARDLMWSFFIKVIFILDQSGKNLFV
jgi:hypothetical protein